jgi:beta-ureidopropionase / N-carbamoyl-L-amino-acid hydrolase
MPDPKPLEDALDTGRFWTDIEQQARIGALHPRGLRRLTLGEADIQARRWLIEKGEEIGCQAHVDALGNVFLRREGDDPGLAPLLIGSHLDSQPNGGAYDGTLGVLAGLAVLRLLHDRGIHHARPVEVVSWTNEEGARFAPGASGSAWFAGRRDAEAILATRDDEGITFQEALSDCLSAMERTSARSRPDPFVPHAFLELHIEQGPVLDAADLPVCAVEGIQGVNWYEVEVAGSANHAGTTPKAARRDAFMGAHALIAALDEAVAARDDRVRFTIGKFAVAPDSVNTIPDRARFSIDLRHPEQAVLDALDADFRRLAAAAWAGCTARLEVTSRVAPVAFDAALVERLDASVTACAGEAPRLVSGAFHDAIHIAHLCPTAMLFAACRDGISHHPDEHVERHDAEVAARVLARTTLELLKEPT